MQSVSEKACPYCSSKNISPAEKEYKTDFTFLFALTVVFILIGTALAVFFLLQLHPIIIILTLVAIITKLMDTAARKRRRKKVEYICLDCDRRFTFFVKSQD